MRRPLAGFGRGAAVAIAFTLLYAGFFAPVLLGGRLLAPGDARELSLPHYHARHTLWTPELFSGFPALADPQTLYWYPPALVLSRLPHSWNAFVLSAYVLASCFTYGYVGLLTGSRRAAFAAGCVYGLSGFFLSHLGHTNVIHSAAWMPLLLWALEELRRQVRPGWVVAAAVAVAGGALAGHPQFAVYAVGLGGVYVLALARRAPAGTAPFAGAALAAIGLGLGLAAIQLLPTLELKGESLRAGLSFREFTSCSLPLQELPRLLFPCCCGGFWDPRTGVRCPVFAGGGGLCESTGYVGLLPLLLAGLGVAAGRDRRLVRFWLAVAIVSLLLALGRRTPLPYLLYHVPVYNTFRIPARHFVHLALAVSVLAGFGVAHVPQLAWPDRLRALGRSSLLGPAVALALLGVFLILYRRGAYTHELAAPQLARLAGMGWMVPALGLPLVVLAVGLAALWWWGRRPGRLTAAVLLGVVVLDLGSFGWVSGWWPDAELPEAFRLPAALWPYRERLATTGQRLAPLVVRRCVESAPPNRSWLWGLQSVLGYSPLALTRYGQFLGVDYVGWASYHCLDPADRSLDLLAARYVLAPRPIPGDCDEALARDLVPRLADPARWRCLGDVGEMTVYENERALPRAWLVPRVRTLAPDAILRAVHESRLPDGTAYDPRQVALVEKPLALPEPGPAAGGAVRLVRLGATDVAVKTRCGAPAFLVLSDVYYPGWQAWVNGLPVRVYRTDYVLRGVPVPAGRSVVRFAFRPGSFYAGAAVTGAALFVALGLLGWAAVRKWRRRAAPDIGERAPGCLAA
jgi:hypothetical protein